MSADENRKALRDAIVAWREARDAYPPGTSEHKKFQRKMKEAEWELQRLGPPEDSPGVVLKVVDPEKPQE